MRKEDKCRLQIERQKRHVGVAHFARTKRERWEWRCCSVKILLQGGGKSWVTPAALLRGRVARTLFLLTDPSITQTGRTMQATGRIQISIYTNFLSKKKSWVFVFHLWSLHSFHIACHTVAEHIIYNARAELKKHLLVCVMKCATSRAFGRVARDACTENFLHQSAAKG